MHCLRLKWGSLNQCLTVVQSVHDYVASEVCITEVNYLDLMWSHFVNRYLYLNGKLTRFVVQNLHQRHVC